MSDIEQATSQLADAHDDVQDAEAEVDKALDAASGPIEETPATEDNWDKVDQAFDHQEEAHDALREADTNVQIAQAESLKRLEEKVDLLITKLTPAEAAAPATETAEPVAEAPAEAVKEIEPEPESEAAPAEKPESEAPKKKRGLHFGKR